jgi:bacterioferritin
LDDVGHKLSSNVGQATGLPNSGQASGLPHVRDACFASANAEVSGMAVAHVRVLSGYSTTKAQCTSIVEDEMPETKTKSAAKADSNHTPPLSREELVQHLNQDLAREYQAIIAYVVYSQVIKGAAYMNIAQELEKHAGEELSHALIISKQIDYLGGTPTVEAKPVKISEKAEEMLRFDLDNENETIRNYRERVRQCEALGEYAIAEHIREILVNEQEHQIDLATALGVDVPMITTPEQRA